MKKKIIIISSVVLSLVIAGLITLFCFLNSFPSNFELKTDIGQMLDLNELLTKDQVMVDRDKIIEYVESVHPYFDLVEDKSAYEETKRSFIEATDKPMTVQELFMDCAGFLNFFQDGHTRLLWNQTTFFSVDLKYDNGFLYYEHAKSPVKTIDGIPVENIFNMINNLYPMENPMAQKRAYEQYSVNLEVLKLCKKNVPLNYVLLKTEDGSEYKFTTLLNTNIEYEKSRVYQKENAVIVDFNLCDDDEVFKQVCNDLKACIKKGMNKVIIDVRGNPGGDSRTCEKLLKILGMRVPEYSMYLRYSPKAAAQNGYKKTSGHYYHKGSVKKAKKNPKIDLIVLTDRYTFSSATMLAVYVRDGKLGRIVGEPSANMPCAYGDNIYFSLPNSGITGTLSHKQFIRPDVSRKNERMLVPDDEINPDFALDRALYLLK